jgi:hypothetical protein
VLASLIASGDVAAMLANGWHPLEVLGVQAGRDKSIPAHDHGIQASSQDNPSVAGLIFSMRRGETVRAIGPLGCEITTTTGPHLWRRVALSGAVAPWDLAP